MNRGAPENFVGHPVADAGKSFLHEQHRLDRRAGAAFEKEIEVLRGKASDDQKGPDGSHSSTISGASAPSA